MKMMPSLVPSRYRMVSFNLDADWHERKPKEVLTEHVISRACVELLQVRDIFVSSYDRFGRAHRMIVTAGQWSDTDAA